jgi:hypothetical protein
MNPGALTSFPDDTIHDDYVVASSATDGSGGKMQQHILSSVPEMDKIVA